MTNQMFLRPLTGIVILNYYFVGMCYAKCY